MKRILLVVLSLLGILLPPYGGGLGVGLSGLLFASDWSITYGAGSPFGATEWREVSTTDFTQRFTQMLQLSFSHQLTGNEIGAATAGYRYPSIGAYLQWMDYSHLRMQGHEPLISSSRKYSYGQIASFGWTLAQPCWTHGRWSGSLKLENGAAYVFDPVYTADGVATLAKPWQILVGVGWYFAYEYEAGEVTIGPHFTHMSNSGLGTYNTGINNFSLCLGYRHLGKRSPRRCPEERSMLERDGTPFHPHYYTSVVAGLGGVFFEHSERANGQMTLMADAMYRLRPSHGLGLGLDYYHCAQPDRCGRTDYLGAGVKYDHWWGGFVLHVQMGAYLNAMRPIKWKGMSRFYENIGYKYVFFRHRPVAPYLGIYTKGNGFNAEQMAFSIGAMIK